jgi:dihydrofolate reductase
MMQVVAESLGASAGLLLGRRTHDEFVQYWPNADPEQNPLAPVMNGMPKYVVSSTLTSTDWQNTHIVSGADGLVGLKALKDSTAGTLSIIGSPTLVRSLVEAGMVDRISLMVYPVVVDEGIKLFGGATQRSHLALRGCTELPHGVLHLTYVPAGARQQGG